MITWVLVALLVWATFAVGWLALLTLLAPLADRRPRRQTQKVLECESSLNILRVLADCIQRGYRVI